MKATKKEKLSEQKEHEAVVPAFSVEEGLASLLTGTHKLDDLFNFLDRFFQANLAKLTAGISPATLASAYCSWLTQLAISPGRQLELALYPVIHSQDCTNKIYCEERAGDGKDVRFQSDSWQYLPWRLGAESFLQMDDWWKRATTNLPGLHKPASRIVSFCTRQIMDALSPSNFVLTNPDLMNETIKSHGFNLFHGTKLAIEDMLGKLAGVPPQGVENFIPGQQVAITPGKVIFKNHLIELIQYEPQTKKVYKEPVLILPAWIMKYYILDLSPENSLVKWLVNHGHTVFIVSWLNPSSKDRNLSMDDYYRLGAMAAIDQVASIFPKRKINLMGYCLGGTLAIITAAAMARAGDKRLNSLSLLAAQGDFTDAGELMLFITQGEIAFLKNMMWEQGYLDTKQMAGSFQMLRSYDLIWSKMVHDYMNGQQRGMIDLLAWNADATRMPSKMHSEYLEKLFLHNDLAEGRYKVEGKTIAPENIRIPAFIVSTERDHVAPWRSVYKLHLMLNGRITFVLTDGGHNAGIVSEPGHKGRGYRIRTQKRDEPYIDSSTWIELAERKKGSWWIAWHKWLAKHSSEEQMAAPKLDSSLPPAPGKYVLQK
jgi:polyhydroxyalkanoate synthase